MFGNNQMTISNFGVLALNRQHETRNTKTTSGSTAVTHIDERRLEEDVAYRVGYVSEFMGFGADDIAAIQGAASQLAPLVPVLVEAVYDKL